MQPPQEGRVTGSLFCGGCLYPEKRLIKDEQQRND